MSKSPDEQAAEFLGKEMILFGYKVKVVKIVHPVHQWDVEALEDIPEGVFTDVKLVDGEKVESPISFKTGEIIKSVRPTQLC